MDKVIIGVGLGARSVAIYEIANRLHLAAAAVQSIAASALLPSTVHAERNPQQLRAMFLRGTRYTVAAALPVTVGLIVFAEPLIHSWIGGSVLASVGPARLFLIYLGFVAFNTIGSTMVVALGRIRRIVELTSMNLVINIVLSIALLQPLGVSGVILGTLIAQAAVFLPQLGYAMRVLGVRAGAFWREVVSPNLLGLVAQAAVAGPLLWVAHRFESFPVVALVLAASIAFSGAAFLRFGIGTEERRELLRLGRDAVSRRFSGSLAHSTAKSN
jgi:O-antigen/teichoic acid export membrane protein